METLVSQQEWDLHYAEHTFSYSADSVIYNDLLRRYVPTGANCLEVGCFPGNFLLFMAREKGCTVSGIDASEHTPRLRERFDRERVKVGSFMKARFEDVEPQPVYDCVSSFGFIEHFPDFHGVIARHAGFLKPGGTLIIGVPHFRRGQYPLRKLLDAKNMAGHHLPCMNLKVLAEAMRGAGLEVTARHYWGTCKFWAQPSGQPRWQRLLISVASRITGWVEQHLNLPNPLFSPFLLIVARKPLK